MGCQEQDLAGTVGQGQSERDSWGSRGGSPNSLGVGGSGQEFFKGC